MNLAPVIIFNYNRPDHSLRTWEALAQNQFAAETELYLYCDGPKANASDEMRQRIAEIHALAKQYAIDAPKAGKFKSVHVVCAEKNKGLANSIIFSSDNGEEFEESPETVLGGSIEIFVRGRSIVARSHLTEPTTIRIVNVAGIKLNDFVLEPGQTVVTPIKIPGVYMANKKKLFVK